MAKISLCPWSAETAAAAAAMYAAARQEILVEEPWRGGDFFTAAGQEARAARAGADPRVQGFHILDGAAIVGDAALEDVRNDDRSCAAIGYWVAPQHRQQGIATAAIEMLIEHAVTELGLHSLTATIDVDNAASRRAVEKNGFTPVGLLRDFMQVNGVWRDHTLYQRIAE